MCGARILFGVIALVTVASGGALAEPPTFSLTDTIAPIYSSQDGFYVQNELLGVASGQLGKVYDYTLAAGVTSQFIGKEQDILNSVVGIFRPLGNYRVGITQSTFVRFKPRFFDFHRIAFPTRLYLQRPMSLGRASVLLPEVSIARRNSIDRPDLERIEIQPSVSFLTAFGGGVLDLTAEFAFQNYDLDGRVDRNLFLDATWAKDLSKHVAVGMNANYTQNWSNRDANYTRFEVGPFLAVSLGTD